MPSAQRALLRIFVSIAAAARRPLRRLVYRYGTVVRLVDGCSL
jgi:hypothetical protein